MVDLHSAHDSLGTSNKMGILVLNKHAPIEVIPENRVSVSVLLFSRLADVTDFVAIVRFHKLRTKDKVSLSRLQTETASQIDIVFLRTDKAFSPITLEFLHGRLSWTRT